MTSDDDCFLKEKSKIDDYVMKVYFFLVFSELLKREGVSVKVEPKCIQSNGEECFHDFYGINDDQVEFQRVCDVAKQYFPTTPEYNQITNRRVREAIEFLNAIGWIEYPNYNGKVTVKTIRKLRSKMVSDVIIKEFCKQQKRTTEQATLDDFNIE